MSDSTENTGETTAATDDSIATEETTIAETFCGDGKLDPGEECDLGDQNADNAACTSQCTLAICGDGLVHDGVEQCDDDEDYCDDKCVLHPTVFLSSQFYSGNLGGLQGADQKCQELADAAGLPGEFQAWLSDSESSPPSRFGITNYPGDFVLVDGTVVAHGWEQLTSGQLEAPISRDENGELNEWLVWTSTWSDGTSSGVHCEDWTSSQSVSYGDIGLSWKTDPDWTAREKRQCGKHFYLYCIQTAPAEP